MSSEPAPPLLTLPEDLLGELEHHLEAAWPNEACGILTTPLRFHPSPNLAGTNAPRPMGFRRSSRRGFVLDLRVVLRAEAAGERLLAIVHSHADAEALFSAEDVACALIGGEPAFPGVEYIVSAVWGGRCVEHRSYRFADGRFRLTARRDATMSGNARRGPRAEA